MARQKAESPWLDICMSADIEPTHHEIAQDILNTGVGYEISMLG